MSVDLILAGGLVVDGTGAPARPADVAIADGRIVEVGDIPADPGTHDVIDVSGLVVAPGFIDVHVHSEWERLLGGRDELCGIRQGVTTELMSPDGFSWAPLPPPRSREVRDYLQVFYGARDVSFEWPTVASFLREFERPMVGNLTPQAPLLPIKVAAMGWDARPATRDELTAMARMLEEWFAEGAVGLAAGLEYQPAASSSTVEELVHLCRIVARHDGVYAPHQRGYLAQVRRGCEESFRIARESGAALHISHLAVTEDAEAALAGATGEGLDVTFEMYPYAASCTHLLMVLPAWAQTGGHAAAMDRLRSPTPELLTELRQGLGRRGGVTLAMVEGEPALEGRTLTELAAAAETDEATYLIQLLREHHGRCLAVYHWPSTLDADAVLHRTLTHPLFIGGSDGIPHGGHPHPRAFGTFARIVGDHVRAGTMPLEEAVRKCSGAAARRFRLDRRGELREGWMADVAVFDADELSDVATYADGRRAPTGMRHVLVAGRPVLKDGAPTGARPGRLLRRES
jgi:N-acyl-D-amino-acid deacylase